MTLTSVTAFAPATVANVGSAFDVIGFAVDSPGDTVCASLSQEQGTSPIRVTGIDGDNGRLPRETDRNTAGVSALALLTHLRVTYPGEFDATTIDLHLKKGLPIGSGLGSSSASTVAAVVAVNHLLGDRLPRNELLRFAMEGERVACGAAHADNVGPSLLGGFVLIRSYTPLDVVCLPSPSTVWVAITTPNVEVRTEDARKILKRSILLSDAISQWGNVGGLVAGVFRNDVELIGRSLADRIIEPERATLIPGFHKAKAAALEAGALGCSISGSGPSMFAVTSSEVDAHRVGSAMVSAFNTIEVSAIAYASQINSRGATILEAR